MLASPFPNPSSGSPESDPGSLDVFGLSAAALDQQHRDLLARFQAHTSGLQLEDDLCAFADDFIDTSFCEPDSSLITATITLPTTSAPGPIGMFPNEASIAQGLLNVAMSRTGADPVVDTKDTFLPITMPIQMPQMLSQSPTPSLVLTSPLPTVAAQALPVNWTAGEPLPSMAAPAVHSIALHSPQTPDPSSNQQPQKSAAQNQQFLFRQHQQAGQKKKRGRPPKSGFSINDHTLTFKLSDPVPLSTPSMLFSPHSASFAAQMVLSPAVPSGDHIGMSLSPSPVGPPSLPGLNIMSTGPPIAPATTSAAQPIIPSALQAVLQPAVQVDPFGYRQSLSSPSQLESHSAPASLESLVAFPDVAMASLDMPSISATLSDPAMAQLLNSLCSSANLASIDGQGLPAVVPNVALDAVPPFLGLQRFGTVVNPAAGLPVVKRKRGRPVGKRDPEKERAKEAAKANAVASAAAAVAAGKKAAAATLAACTSAQRSTPSAPSIPTGAATSHVWQAGTRPAGSAVEAAKLPIMPLVKPSSTKAPAKTMPHQLKEQRKVAHSAIERRYRNNINDRIAELKAVIPALNASAACPSSDKFARGASHFGNEHECESDDDCEAEDSSVVIDGVAVAQKINKATILRKAAEYIAHLRRANQVLKDQVDSSRKCVQDHGSPELLLLLEDNLRAVKERHQTETVQRQVKLEDSPLSPVLSGVPSMSSPSTSCSHDSPPSSGFTSAQLHTDSPPPLVLESPTTSSEDESDGYPSPKRARHTGNPAAHVAPARMMMLVFVCACMLYAPNPFGSALVSLNGPASPDHHHSPARVFDAGLSSAMPGQPQTAVWSPEIMWPILRIVLTLLVLWKCLNPSMSTHTATFKPVKKPTDQYHSSQLSFEAEPSDVSQHCTSQLESPANKSRLWMLRLAQEAGAYLIGPRLCLGRAAVTNAGELHEYILLVRRLESDLLLKDNYQPLQLSQILRLANVANASPEILGAELCGRALLLCALRIQRAIVARHPPRKSGKAIKRPAVSATGSGHIMLLLWQQLSMSLLAKGIEMLQSAGASLTDPHLNWFLRVTREEKVNPMSLLDESVHTSSSESAGAAQPAQEAARSNLFAHAMASYRRSRLHELLGEAHVIRHLSLLPLHEEPAADPSGSVSPGIDGILAEIKRLGQASMDCQDFLGYAICELVQVGDMMRSGQTSEAVERYLALEQAIPPECLRQRYEVFSTLSLSVFLVACHYRQLNHAQQEQHISNSAGVLTTLSKQTDWVVCGWQELDRYTKEQLLHPSPNDRDGSSLVLLQAMFLNWALLTVPTGEGHHECGITSCAAGDSSRRCCLRTHADKVRFCMNDLIMGRLKASKGAARETLLEILKYWRQKTMLSE